MALCKDFSVIHKLLHICQDLFLSGQVFHPEPGWRWELSHQPLRYSLSEHNIHRVPDKHRNHYCLLWALPTPNLWNRIGNFWQYYKCRRNRQRAGIRGLKELPHSCFSFLLQISSEPFSVKDYQLIQYLIPVPVSLRPLFDYVLAGKIQHLFQCRIAWEYAFCFRDFPILTV